MTVANHRENPENVKIDCSKNEDLNEYVKLIKRIVTSLNKNTKCVKQWPCSQRPLLSFAWLNYPLPKNYLFSIHVKNLISIQWTSRCFAYQVISLFDGLFLCSPDLLVFFSWPFSLTGKCRSVPDYDCRLRRWDPSSSRR